MKSAALLLLLAVSFAQAAGPSLDAPGIIRHGPRDSREVALTFDADMTAGMEGKLRNGSVRSFDNETVVQALGRTRTPATFFLTGMWAQVYPVSARAMARNPLFEIENHSYDYPGFSQPCYGLRAIADADKGPNVARAQRAIWLASGITPRFFRFPGGCAAKEDVQRVQAAGLQVVHWDVIGGDVKQPDPSVIVRDVLGRVRGGSIVVLHVSGGHAPATGQALPAIIAGLRARNYDLVTVKTLLGQ